MTALDTASTEEVLKMVDAIHRLRAVETGKQRVELRRRSLELRDQRMGWNRKRYQRETTELFIRWYENPEARKIVDGPGDLAEKIERLGRAMFGEDW